ncbi:MAG: ABC transporter ATP-binding protein, partial [Acetivibrio ethanolgignens]
LMSSHMFEEVERTCDRTAIIKNGRLVAVETLEKLKESKRKIFELKAASEEEATELSKALPGSEKKGVWVNTTDEGNMDGFLKKISHFSIADMNVRTQTLEELFMNYYGEELK